MQKKNPLYNEMKEETVWTMERFNNYINENFAATKSLPPDWVFSVFTVRSHHGSHICMTIIVKGKIIQRDSISFSQHSNVALLLMLQKKCRRGSTELTENIMLESLYKPNCVFVGLD